MTGTSNAYIFVLKNVANIATIILSQITTHLKTISRVKTLKHESSHVKRHRNIGNGGWGLKKATVAPYIEYHLYWRYPEGSLLLKTPLHLIPTAYWSPLTPCIAYDMLIFVHIALAL